MKSIVRGRQSDSDAAYANPTSLTGITQMTITNHFLRGPFAIFFAIILSLTCVWALTNPPAMSRSVASGPMLTSVGKSHQREMSTATASPILLSGILQTVRWLSSRVAPISFLDP
jgi:hypothetical protein